MGKVGSVYRGKLVEGIKQGVEENSSTFLLKYSAVSSSRMDDLRKGLRAVGARVCASRNRLAQIALKELQQDDLAQVIAGQTAFVWSCEDSVAVSKALIDFADKCEGVTVEGGILDGAYLNKDAVKQLSELPSKDVLRSQLLALILSPVTRLAGIFNAKSRDLLSILKQLSEKKEGGN